jgi:hypothetical protein
MATKAKNNMLVALEAELAKIEKLGLERATSSNKAEQCKLDALFCYGDAVKEGIAAVSFDASKRKAGTESDNAETFVDRYFKGFGRADNKAVTVSQFRLGAFPEVLAQRAAILKTCQEYAATATREQMGDKSLYNVFIQTCGKIKKGVEAKAKDPKAKVPSISAALKETVTKKPGNGTTNPPASKKKQTPEQILEENKKLFLTLTRDLMSLPKGLPHGAKAMLKSLFNLKWNVELEAAE